MLKCLLDTSVYVDLHRARRHRNQGWALNTLHNANAYVTANGRPYLSTISVMEIARGIQQELGTAKLRAFREVVLPSFEIIDFETNAALLAGEIYAKLDKEHHRIGIPDTAIASIAICLGLKLVTSNPKHFQRIVDLGFPLVLGSWRLPEKEVS